MTEETVYESTTTRSRAAIASYLRRVADALDDGDTVPADDDGSVTVDPPAEPAFGVEVEREDDDLSIEFEMEWPEEEGGVETGATGSKATFELYRDRADEWRWRLRHANGNVIADGGEGYARRAGAENGIRSVKTNAAGATIEKLD